MDKKWDIETNVITSTQYTTTTTTKTTRSSMTTMGQERTVKEGYKWRDDVDKKDKKRDIETNGMM